MDFKEFLATLTDESAITFANALNAKATNSEELVKQIGVLENKNTEILASRTTKDKKYSEMLAILGVDELTEETMKKFNSSKGDDKSLAEIANLKGLLEKATTDNATQAKEFGVKLSDMAMTNSLRDLGIGLVAANAMTENHLLGHLKEGATFENDSIVYKKDDGTTIYGTDNKPLTPASKFEQMKSDENYAPFFKNDFKSGVNTNPNQNKNSNAKTISRSQLEGMSPAQQNKHFADGGSLTD